LWKRTLKSVKASREIGFLKNRILLVKQTTLKSP